MTMVYLNGDYMPMSEAKISPMDRGFLFGDGIYEVIPSYCGQLVGFGPHINRMQDGLTAIGINLDFSHQQWRELCTRLMTENDGDNLGIYLHVSRGMEEKRFHAYPENIKPTVYAFTFDIASAPVADKTKVKGYKVSTTEDMRWRRCNIKSTSLLGNVMHFQKGHEEGNNETILYNSKGELTEASACNVYIVKNGVVITPPLDNQLLAGITRHILLDVLAKDGTIKVEERTVMLAELRDADEVWVTSSSKEVAPVIEVDGAVVGSGEIGDVWLAAQKLYSAGKSNY
jgi:D-alanine transaminase